MNNSVAKKPYARPQLISFGQFDEITLSGGKPTIVDGASMGMPTLGAS